MPAEMTWDLDSAFQAMIAEMQAGPAVYRPSEMWKQLNTLNVDQLRRHGLPNFKRSINQNYYNWIPRGLEDNQMRALLDYWKAHPALAPFCVDIEEVEAVEYIQGTLRLDQDNLLHLYRLFVGLLWYFTESHDPEGLCARLEEPELGNPIRTRRDGRLISQDLANAIRERSMTRPNGRPDAPRVVGELGAGYGRVAHVFLEAEDCRYVIVDVPPALLISQWYLTQTHPDAPVFTFRRFEAFAEIEADLVASRIAFLAPSQLELLPDGYFDDFMAISCLQELTLGQIDRYRGLIAEKTRERVYFKNWNRWRNPWDGLELTREHYLLDAPWTPVIDRLDPVQDLFRELVFERRG